MKINGWLLPVNFIRTLAAWRVPWLMHATKRYVEPGNEAVAAREASMGLSGFRNYFLHDCTS